MKAASLAILPIVAGLLIAGLALALAGCVGGEARPGLIAGQTPVSTPGTAAAAMSTPTPPPSRTSLALPPPGQTPVLPAGQTPLSPAGQTPLSASPPSATPTSARSHSPTPAPTSIPTTRPTVRAVPNELPDRFDPDRAFAHLERQVAFGPRVPGTVGHAAAQAYLVEQLRAVADDVSVQPFAGAVPTGTIPMANIVGVLGPSKTPKVVLAAHWDTRPTAENDPDPSKRSQPIPGANDGASGVAVLLEVARVLAVRPPAVGVAIVFFDGEDYGPGEANMFLGSRFFAEHPVPARPKYAVLVDMVCQRDLSLPVEHFSATQARAIVEKVWSTAERLGYREFRRDPGPAIVDDHVSLQRAGIPAIDVIDFHYPAWHTLQDTPDKCDPQSLERVGTVLLETLWAEPDD